jgi:hypothetical protein
MANVSGAVPRVWINDVEIGVWNFSIDPGGLVTVNDTEIVLGCEVRLEWGLDTLPLGKPLITDVRLTVNDYEATILWAKFCPVLGCEHRETVQMSVSAKSGQPLMETVICLHCHREITRPWPPAEQS